MRGVGFFDQFMQTFMFAFVVTAEQNLIAGPRQFGQFHKGIATTAGEALNRFNTQVAGCFVAVRSEGIDRDRSELCESCHRGIDAVKTDGTRQPLQVHAAFADGLLQIGEHDDCR